MGQGRGGGHGGRALAVPEFPASGREPATDGAPVDGVGLGTAVAGGLIAGSGLGAVSVLATLILTLSLSFGGCQPTGPSTLPVRDGLDLAATPGGATVAVAESSGGLLDVVRLGRLVAQAPVGGQTAGVALLDGGTRALVTDVAIGSPAGVLAEVDVATGQVLRRLPVGSGATGVVVSGDGATAYVADSGYLQSGSVDVVDVRGWRVVATMPVGRQPTGLALGRDGRRLYVADTALGSPTGTVSVLDTVDDTVSGTIPVGGRPVFLALSPDGRRLYVADHGSATVSVVDTVSDQVVATWPVPGGAFGVAPTPDGTGLWVTQGYASVLGLFGLGPDGSPWSPAVVLLRTADGSVRRSFRVPGDDPTAVTATATDVAVVADGSSPDLHRLDAATGAVATTGVPGLAKVHGAGAGR